MLSWLTALFLAVPSAVPVGAAPRALDGYRRQPLDRKSVV